MSKYTYHDLFSDYDHCIQERESNGFPRYLVSDRETGEAYFDTDSEYSAKAMHLISVYHSLPESSWPRRFEVVKVSEGYEIRHRNTGKFVCFHRHYVDAMETLVTM